MAQARGKRIVISPVTTASADDDRKRLEDQAEKKKVQNRLAQRNYRQKVKSRIEDSEREKRLRIELEQQNSAQAELIRAQATLLACSNQQGAWQSHRALSESTIGIQDYVPQSTEPRPQLPRDRQPNYDGIDILQEQFGQVGNRHSYLNAVDEAVTPTAGQFGDSFSPVLSNLSHGNTSSSIELSSKRSKASSSTSQGFEKAFSPENVDILNTMSLPGVSHTEQPRRSKSRTSGDGSPVQEPFAMLGDWSMNSDDCGPSILPVAPHQRQPDKATHSSNSSHTHGQQSSPWRDIDPASVSSPARLTLALSNSTPQSISERIELMIQTARGAGFESLEHTVSVLHTTKFEEGSACSNAQRLGRLRRLPNLLDSLLSDSDSWTKRELIKVREAILRAAENFLVQERCAINHGSDLFQHIHELLASPSEKRCTHVSNQLQDQLPGLTSIITTILLHVAEQSSSVHQARLVLTIQVIIVLAGEASLEHISALIASLLTV